MTKRRSHHLRSWQYHPPIRVEGLPWFRADEVVVYVTEPDAFARFADAMRIMGEAFQESARRAAEFFKAWPKLGL